jgi:hypothetical protein
MRKLYPREATMVTMEGGRRRSWYVRIGVARICGLLDSSLEENNYDNFPFLPEEIHESRLRSFALLFLFSPTTIHQLPNLTSLGFSSAYVGRPGHPS